MDNYILSAYASFLRDPGLMKKLLEKYNNGRMGIDRMRLLSHIKWASVKTITHMFKYGEVVSACNEFVDDIINVYGQNPIKTQEEIDIDIDIDKYLESGIVDILDKKELLKPYRRKAVSIRPKFMVQRHDK